MGASMLSSVKKPEPGDLIEIPRRLYSHWAVYLGDGNVIHLTGSCKHILDGSSGYFNSSRPSPNTKKGILKKEPLNKVVAGGIFCTNNKYDEIYDCRPVEEILRIAEAIVGIEVDYDLFRKNCEHFATWLRYRVPRSEQAEALEEGLGELADALDLSIGAFKSL